jgi:hypothetical protein
MWTHDLSGIFRLGEGTLLTITQRNLNNCFAYDLVPSPAVITAALRAARRVNDFPSAVRVFEGTCFADYASFSHESVPHICTLQALMPCFDSPNGGCAANGDLDY